MMKHFAASLKVPAKRVLLISSVLLIVVLAAVGGTQAYMLAKTQTVQNNLAPGVADITISEPNGSSYTLSPNSVDKIVAVQNPEGDHAIPVYVRARLVPILRSSSGDGTGVEVKNVTYPGINTTSWVKIGDYYYYKAILQPGTTTPNLITKAQVSGETIPDGQHLEIQVIADSIQTVANAEFDAWKLHFNGGAWSAS